MSTAKTQEKPAGAVASSGSLAALRSRLLARAVGCSTHKQQMIADGCWHEAHEAEVRRGIWLMAADMAEQEELTANTELSGGAKIH